MDKLIEMVRKKPYLYDKSNAGYRNILLKEKTWKEIAKTLNIDELKCKNKWKGLRDSFYREVKKQQQRSGSDIELSSKWKHFEKMKFLRSVPQIKRIISEFELLGYGKQEHDSRPDDLYGMNTSDEDSDTTHVYTKSSIPTSTTIPNCGRSDTINLAEICNSTDDEFKRFLMKILSSNTDRDDNISLFFQSAAGMIRNVNFSQIETIELQMEILSTIKMKIQNRKKF